MLRLLWVLVKIGALVAGAMWLSARPGTVSIQWMDYDITIHFGFFLMILFIAVLLTIGLTRLGLFITNLPGSYKTKKSLKNAEKGLEALTLSLSSAAAGDYGYTQFQAARALKLLPGHQPLPLMLQAGAQRKQGHYEEADATLKALLSHPEGAVLAARALIGNAIEQQNIPAALTYARTAEREYKGKDTGWLYKTLYELEACAENWDAANTALQKARKQKAISKDKADSDMIAILTAQGQACRHNGQLVESEKLLKAALKKQAGFIPAIETLFEIYEDKEKKRAATSLLQKAWQANPHPQITRLWRQLGLQSGKKDYDLKWLQKLLKYHPDHYESAFARAQWTFEQAQYEESKTALEQAITHTPQKRFYKLMIDLAHKTGSSAATIQHYLELMGDAKADPTWLCSLTGQIYAHWQPITPPHGAFNALIWASPDEYRKNNHILNDNDQMFELLTASSSAS